MHVALRIIKPSRKEPAGVGESSKDSWSLDVRFGVESGHKWHCQKESANSHKRTSGAYSKIAHCDAGGGAVHYLPVEKWAEGDNHLHSIKSPP